MPPIAGVNYRRDEPAEALAAIGLDPWTAVAVASHDAELDRDALLTALPAQAFYVGALGARRRAPERRAQLTAAGLSASAIDRLRSPIGVEIGGKAPWEIAAVSALAEITTPRATPPARRSKSAWRALKRRATRRSPPPAEPLSSIQVVGPAPLGEARPSSRRRTTACVCPSFRPPN